LPGWIDARIELQWPFTSICDQAQRKSLLTQVIRLNEAKTRGVEALFNYYWPIWEQLQAISSQGAQQ